MAAEFTGSALGWLGIAAQVVALAAAPLLPISVPAEVISVLSGLGSAAMQCSVNVDASSKMSFFLSVFGGFGTAWRWWLGAEKVGMGTAFSFPWWQVNGDGK
jgi:hypothetical protein